MGDRCGGVCHGLAWWVIAGAVVATGAEPAAVPDQASAKEAAEAQEFQKAAKKAQEEAAEIQRLQQIARMTEHLQQVLMPALHAELELVRQTCGSLPDEARKKILAAGKKEVQAVAKLAAERPMDFKEPRRRDIRKAIHDAVEAAVKPHATAEEFAAYEREQAARIARRSRAARILIVNRVDGELPLSQDQREKIEADLENRWDAAWLQVLDDTGMVIGGRPLAPDFADKCIAPHLDERQRAEWQAWCKQARWSRHGQNFGWNFDGQGMQLDPWWSR